MTDPGKAPPRDHDPSRPGSRPIRLLSGTFTIFTGPAFEITSSNVEAADLAITGAGNVVSDGAVAPGQVRVYGIALTDLTNVATDRTTSCAVTGKPGQPDRLGGHRHARR